MSAAKQKKPATMDVEKTMGDISSKVEDATKNVDSSLSGVTKMLETFFKSWPKLPTVISDFLKKYAAILVLIGGGLALLFGVLGLLSLPTLWASNGFPLSGYLTGLGVGLGTYKMLQTLNVAYMILSGGLLLAAYTPLKANKLTGWKFVYWSGLVGVVYTIISNLLLNNLGGLIFGVLFSLVGLWIVFSLRPAFNKK